MSPGRQMKIFRNPAKHFSQSICMHQAVGRICIFCPHSECQPDHQSQHTGDKNSSFSILSVPPPANEKIPLLPLLPERLKLFRQSLAVRIRLKNIISPMFQRIMIPEEKCRSVACIWFRHHFQQRVTFAEFLQNLIGSVPAPVINHKQPRHPACCMPFHNRIPVLYHMLYVFFFIVCRYHNI